MKYKLVICLAKYVVALKRSYAYTRFGKPHNGELVDKIVKMAETIGREVATPAQAREILKMPQRSKLPPLTV
ncbi:MAG: 3-keto-5-aminohexanoate cleavage protein [Phormidium sp.]